MPEPSDLKDLAKREGLGYEITPMLSREEAERYGQISGAEIGLTRLSGGRKFADEFFDPKTSSFEPEELTDILGTRYLARKFKDVPPRIPTLDEVRPQVSLAWKMDKARPLAQKAADLMAEQIKKQGGHDQGEYARRIPSPDDPADRAATGQPCSPADSKSEQPEESPIPEVPHPGDAFRNAYFCAPDRLGRGRTQSARNDILRHGPRSSRAGLLRCLYAPNGDEFRYKMVARAQAEGELIEHWMGWLDNKPGSVPTGSHPTRPRQKPTDRRVEASSDLRADRRTRASAERL